MLRQIGRIRPKLHSGFLAVKDTHQQRSSAIFGRFSVCFFLPQLARRSVTPEFSPSGPASLGDLMGGGATDDLNKILGTYMPGKCGFHFVGVEFKVFLRSPYRFVQRKANLCPSEKSSSHRVFTGLTQRDLPQKQSLGLMQFIRRDIFRAHLGKITLI